MPNESVFLCQKEFASTSLDSLISVLNSSLGEPVKRRRRKPFKFYLNGTLSSAYRLVRKYGLRFNNANPLRYGFFKSEFPSCPNTYFASPQSMYGQFLVNMNINGNFVQVRCSPKSSVFYSEYNLVEFTENCWGRFVVLDLETTGLSPFLDDVIEISLYDPFSKKEFFKRLPLEKKTSVPQDVTEINGIKTEDLKKAAPLTQEEINRLIKDFDLSRNVVAIWTGSNLFDAVFLNNYFFDHGLRGLGNFRFCNTKSFVEAATDKCLGSYKKDDVATYFKIPLINAHSALGDCKIEAEILLKSINLCKTAPIGRKDRILLEFLAIPVTEGNAKRRYDDLVKFCRAKHGRVFQNYDELVVKRGSEWIDIHHIDEVFLDDIAVRTQLAKAFNDEKSLAELRSMNAYHRLVYATIPEHFLLHYLIEYIRGPLSSRKAEVGGGPHWLYGYMIRAKFSIVRHPYEKGIFERFDSFFPVLSFEQITELYKDLIRKEKLKENDIVPFYKIQNPSKECQKFIDSLFA